MPALVTKATTVLVLACLSCVSGFFQNPFSIRKATSAAVPARSLQDSIGNLCKNKNNGITVLADEKQKVLELVRQLEKQNPSKNIGANPMMNGAWTLVYTSNTGSSAGKLGPFVGKVVQDIDVSKKLYTNYAIFGNGLLEASLLATWDDLNPKLWRVRFKSIVFKVLGVKVAEKSLDAVGIWRMSYLDDQYRVLYAKGREDAATPENIYVLKK